MKFALIALLLLLCSIVYAVSSPVGMAVDPPLPNISTLPDPDVGVPVIPDISTLPSDPITIPPNSTTANVTNTTNATNTTSPAVNTTIPPVVNVSTVKGVLILYPGNVSTSTINITYIHNATSANCVMYIDSSIARVHNNVLGLQLQTALISSPLAPGIHRIDVACTSGSWSATATVNTTVQNSSGSSLQVTPLSIFPGQNITITGTLIPQTRVVISITNPVGNVITFNTSTGTSPGIIATYSVPVQSKTGTYLVNAVAVDDTTVTSAGSFKVVSLSPSIALEGNATNATPPFTVLGSQFSSNDIISIVIIGGGRTITNSTQTDANGDFSYLVDDLPPGTYSIAARGTKDPTLTVSLNILSTVSTEGVPTPPNTLPIIGTENPQTTTPEPQTPQEVPQTTDQQSTPNIQIPPPVAKTTESPSQIQTTVTSGGFPWRWVLIPLLFILIIGGTGAFLVNNGTLDISSVDAFKESFNALLNGSSKFKGSEIAPNMPVASNPIRDFIIHERQKGFDDLTVRSALLAKGWSKRDVDATFDEIYRS